MLSLDLGIQTWETEEDREAGISDFHFLEGLEEKEEVTESDIASAINKAVKIFYNGNAAVEVTAIKDGVETLLYHISNEADKDTPYIEDYSDTALTALKGKGRGRERGLPCP